MNLLTSPMRIGRHDEVRLAIRGTVADGPQRTDVAREENSDVCPVGGD